ncbi:RhoGAP domain-containing protein [Serpula lacrymans var. lacrymans S7.9]|uniref:RhoGAP domain-containing protein n=1 Tax=Serpula lacrymans var. lacrymans (strain S7.9) TaxID=578457 RepID=F8NRS1_SERL9|nr:RhoGAP domain-containing protein [Serpula lacrymans var. lacrymans S7.9]EGO27037.1 RhoGAP domain-containing protein [Serpula lacrymans var. lacrymans S7.9]
MNLGSTRIDCTLILHTLLGKDHFITVRGEYQYTCFANSLSRLTRLPGPIRSVKSPQNLILSNGRQSINAPREIMRLINWLMSYARDSQLAIVQYGLFTSPVDESLVADIRESLDTGNDFPPRASPHDRALVLAVGSTLLQLLDSLTEPVVPASLHAKCLEAENRDEAFELLDGFPTESVNVWVSVTAFLHYISQQGSSASSPNQSLRARALASTFAPILLRDDASNTYPRVSPIGKQNFLLFFIN